jgi:hypothetical protein
MIIILFIAQLWSATPGYGQTFTFEGKRKKEAMSFQLIKNLIILPLYINGKGPFNFILDTGVNPLIITDASILDSINLKGLRTTKLGGIGAGNEIEAYLSDQIHVRLGHARLNNMPTAILKNDLFNLSSYVGTHIYGLIGYYFFHSFTVRIKYPAKRMIFTLPEINLKHKGENIPIELIGNKPYVDIFVSPEAEERIAVKMILDIGASHAISLESLNNKPFPLPKKTIKANLGIGFAGLISGSIGRINEVEIGNFSFNNVLSSFPEFEQAGAKTGVAGRNGNIGSNLLKHFDITFDYTKLEMYLKPNSFKNLPFEHDMSGMEVFIQEGKPVLYFIGRIEPDSPAENAGILTNDQLLSINFKPVNDYKLDEIDLLLKGGDGKRLILQLFREKKVIYKVLILKRRI